MRGGDGPRVTPQQMEVLRSLHPSEPVMVGELADHLGVTPSTVSLMLKRMEERGLVARRRDPADRRAMNVYLTPEGEALAEAWSDLDPELLDRVLLALDPVRRTQVLRGLNILAEAADRFVRAGGAHVAALTGGEAERLTP